MDKNTLLITNNQVNFFHNEGYLCIEKLTDSDDVALIKEIYDDLFNQQVGRNIGDHFDLAGTDEDNETASLPQILNPDKYAPEINQSQLLVNATSVAKQLLGKDATCSFAHAILKPAKIGAETPWHQDAAYWDPSLLYRSLSIWVPLQDVNEENGCMHFSPESHKTDVFPHQSINNDPRIHGLELAPEEMENIQNVVSCPLPTGGATFHDAYLLHHTPPNQSNTPRRALILNATLSVSTRSKPLSFPWVEGKQTARAKRAINGDN